MNTFIFAGLLTLILQGATKPPTELSIHVSNIKSATAPLRIGIYNDASRFPDENGCLVTRVVVPGKTGEFTVTISGLGAGDYALAVYQDIDNNGKLSKNIFGYPKEPFCFSNNIKPVFSAPAFSKCKVTLASPASDVYVKLLD